jgi:replicative DNA helicase
MNLNISDLDAERSVLGSIILDANVMDKIGQLESRDFKSFQHQEIFKVLKYMNEHNKPIDLVTVTSEYVRFGKLDNIGGVDYLASLADSVPTTSNADYYAKVIRSKALRRRGAEIGHKIAALAEEEHESDEDYFAKAEELVDQMRPMEAGKMLSLKEIRSSYMQHLKTQVSAIPTGFPAFDAWCKGLGRGDLFISAGRPSMGKTAKLLRRIAGVLKNQTAGVVLLYSQEMSNEEIIDRMVSAETGIPFARIKQKKLSETDWIAVNNWYDFFEKKPLFIQDSSGVTIQEIRSTARRFKRQYGKIDMIAVDYLQIMHIPEKKNETRAKAIGRVTGTAKKIAREMDCNFMMLSQMTRESEQKKKPQLSDLKESGDIEQDADVVEFLWANPNDIKINKPGRVVQQFIAKGRNIGINDFRLLFRNHVQQFEELPDRKAG